MALILCFLGIALIVLAACLPDQEHPYSSDNRNPDGPLTADP
jgi:hypothetical protein